MRIECVFSRPGWARESEPDWGDMYAFYRAASKDDLPVGATDLQFSAKGPLLPHCKYGKITLHGAWDSKSRSSGPVFLVDGYDEYIPDNSTACAAFLSTLPGCSEDNAVKIANMAGPTPMSNLDIHFEEVIHKAVSNNAIAERIITSYKVIKSRDIVFYLSNLTSYEDMKTGKTHKLRPPDFQLCAKVAVSAETLYALQRDPFSLVLDSALPFKHGIAIADTFHISRQSKSAVKAAVLDAIKQFEGSSQNADATSVTGNTCCLIEDLLSKAGSLCGYPADAPELVVAVQELLEEGYCVCAENKYIYRKVMADAEYTIAREVFRLLTNSKPVQREYKWDIYSLENERRMRLAPEQRRSVKKALANTITLLIGGPGTGKTTIEQFIIEVFKKYNDSNVVLLAPTGKAACRMSESCGYPASTVHKALNIIPDSGSFHSDVKFDAGLILVDECSMLDTEICAALLKAVQDGTQIVFVGDTNQLPSVGPGNVLYELIHSEVVPIAELNVVYRQAAGSLIAQNCARIKIGETDLSFGDPCQFIEVPSPPLSNMTLKEKMEVQHEAQKIIMDLYKKEIAAGRSSEDICILSPFRRSTPCGVNALNELIQKTYIPVGTPKVSNSRKTFFLGDKVMYMRNSGEVFNGDTGYVTEVLGNKFVVDFKDGRVITFTRADIKDFELAYAITTHKSQGAEFPVCIIPVLPGHDSMLKRNLLYTAVSRAKSVVYFVGTPDAIKLSILTEEVTRRTSRLKTILRRTGLPVIEYRVAA